MALFNRATGILKRLKRDESGMATLAWALSLTAIIASVGAAMDYALLSHADARSQSIADTTALAAAIYVKNTEQVPTDRNKGLVGEYTADELGYDYRKWVIDGAEGVKVNVSYDNISREATATVVGYTRPNLMQILGFSELKFTAKSVVKYFEKDIQNPASIVMVLDNSGSMHFDDLPVDPISKNAPVDGITRISGLISSSKNFMTDLETAVGPQPEDGSVELVLRTGMMAFDSAIVRTVPMDWGYIPDSEFDAMTPLAATNSAPPLTVANTWLNVTEPTEHEENLPGKTPLKYLILMTDGKNTIGAEEWVARTGTQNWRRYVTNRTSRTGLSDVETNYVETAPESCTTEFEDRWEYICNLSDSKGNNWRRSFGVIDYRADPTSGSYSYEEEKETGKGKNKKKKTETIYVRYNCASEESDPVEVETCSPPEFEPRYSGYEYFEGIEPYEPDPNWEEGEFDITSNIQTREECDSLHAAGVEVFTVGFALVPGQFEVNNWPGRSSYGDIYPPDVDPFTGEEYTESDGVESANKAKGILQYCASSPQNYITADNSEALQAAFDRIGNTIIKEIIRIDS
ncbi:pilus assembly protein TadG-related protein [Hellea sp.]|nr:pilus assembly protein TadG-related protein [Hellea sp.]